MKNEIQVSSKEQTEKQMVNPFPNVRMIVKDGKQLWCLKDFAIAIGYTGEKCVNSVMKLLNDVEKDSVSDVDTQSIDNMNRQIVRKMSYVPIELLNAIINRTTLKTPSVTEWRTKMQQVGGEAVKSQLGIENDMMQIVENESITGYPIVKNANKPIDFAKMEQLRDVFGTDVPFRLVGDKPYWGANSVLKILGFGNPRSVLQANSICPLNGRVEREENGIIKTRELNFINIDDINKIILNSRKSNPMIDKWKETNRTISGEAVKSQLGIENDIDKMVNERVEKALALHNNNDATIALCNNMTMLLAKFDEDSKRRDEENKRRDEENKRRDEENKRFYAELFGKTNKLEDKVVTVNPYKFSMTEIATYIPGQNATTLNRMLLAHEYLYKKNGVYYPTERMKELGYYTDLCNKYHTPVYKVEMIDFMKQLVREDKQELADKKE